MKRLLNKGLLLTGVVLLSLMMFACSKSDDAGSAISTSTTGTMPVNKNMPATDTHETSMEKGEHPDGVMADHKEDKGHHDEAMADHKKDKGHPDGAMADHKEDKGHPDEAMTDPEKDKDHPDGVMAGK